MEGIIHIKKILLFWFCYCFCLTFCSLLSSVLCLPGTLKQVGTIFMATFTTCTSCCIWVCIGRFQNNSLIPLFPQTNTHSFIEGAELVPQRQGLVSVLSQSSWGGNLGAVTPFPFQHGCACTCSGLGLSRDGFGIGSMCISGDLRSRL